MRSLLLALGAGILALNLAGCSCTINSCAEPGVVSGDCGPACQTCDQECDGGCDECVRGRAVLARPVLNGRVRSAVSSVRCRCGAMGDCGCDAGADCGGECGANCGCGAAAPAPRMTARCTTCGDNECGCDGRQRRLGMGLFEAGPACSDGCNNGLLGNLGMARGCGQNGCGMGGKLCGRCNGGGLLGKARGCGRTGCGLGGMLCNDCRGGLGSRLGSRMGCGQMGCGQDGNLCNDCQAGGLLARGGLGMGGRMGGDGMGLGGRMGDGMGLGSRMGAGLGCGRMGCGIGGRLCDGCRSRRGLATGGTIPHMQPMPSAAGQVPTYVYPYYTTRAPRDFLMDNPPSIGY